MRIALIMLAAGNSRRFGGNKLLYEIDGNPMYRYILERLIAVAGAGGQGKEVSSCVLETGSLKNIKQEMTVTVVTQYEEIEEDQPWLTAGTIRQLITLLETTGKGIACVSSEGRLGNPCIFTKKYYDQLLSITGDRGGKSVITAHRDDTAVLKVEDGKELTDIDVKTEAGRGQM